MRHVILVLGLLLGACEPTGVGCWDESTPDWPADARPHYVFTCDGLTLQELDTWDDPSRITVVVCGDDWALRCDGEGTYELSGARPMCSDRGETEGCLGSDEAECVTIPCDGEWHYGTDDPGAP